MPKKRKELSKGTIDLKVLAQLNKQTHIEGPFVNVVQFHETSTVAMVAGSSGVLSLFEVCNFQFLFLNKLCKRNIFKYISDQFHRLMDVRIINCTLQSLKGFQYTLLDF